MAIRRSSVHPRPRGEHASANATDQSIASVHPRPRGEHSFHNALIEKVLLDATKRTSLARLSLDRGERPDF